MNYYNENDPFAAAWLRELIKAGHIPAGEVDERSIEDVCPIDLRGYAQCHFFAGIGGWSRALQLAHWPSDRAVWTGSCPCQPFSTAGKGGGFADERHLWPAFFHLIQQCKPATILGEQVASPDGLKWFDLVSTDLEVSGYAVGAADLCAAGVGAPHIRQRLYWVADSGHERRWGRSSETSNGRNAARIEPEGLRAPGSRMGQPNRNGCESRQPSTASVGQGCAIEPTGSVEHATGEQVGFSGCTWFDGRPCDWIACQDGKQRPVEPGAFPLAHGVPNRVGRLRGYGNAIVPQVAQAFIEAFLDR